MGVPYGYPHLSSTEGLRIQRYQDDVGRLILIILNKFAGFYSRRPETFKPDDARGSSLLGWGNRVRWHGEVSWLSHLKQIEVIFAHLIKDCCPL